MVETVIEKKTNTKRKFKKPDMYKVIFLNDNVTHFDFVMSVLINIFGKSREEAFYITKTVHEEGSGIAGIYYKEIAEQKKLETLNMAKKFNFPLQVILEKE